MAPFGRTKGRKIGRVNVAAESADRFHDCESSTIGQSSTSCTSQVAGDDVP
jgi:hypothetical protein